jgi:hypothetical protein
VDPTTRFPAREQLGVVLVCLPRLKIYRHSKTNREVKQTAKSTALVSVMLLFSSTSQLRGNVGVLGLLQGLENSDISALFVHATKSGVRKNFSRISSSSGCACGSLKRTFLP